MQLAPGSKVGVPIVLDMSAGAGTNLAALTTGLAFGTTRLTLDSIAAGGFGSLTANTTNAAAGSATLSTFDATGTTTTVTMATAWFTASATTGGTTVGFTPTVARSDVGASILDLVRVQNLDVCVAPSGKWGDATGDGAATPNTLKRAQRTVARDVAQSSANQREAARTTPTLGPSIAIRRASVDSGVRSS